MLRHRSAPKFVAIATGLLVFAIALSMTVASASAAASHQRAVSTNQECEVDCPPKPECDGECPPIDNGCGQEVPREGVECPGLTPEAPADTPDTVVDTEVDRGTMGSSEAVAGASAAPVAVAGAGAAPTHSGALPYTGQPLAWLALFGAMLLTAGIVLRVELRRRDRDDEPVELTID